MDIKAQGSYPRSDINRKYEKKKKNISAVSSSQFIYLGSAVTTKNDVSLEIKRRITLVNRCYYGLNGQLSNKRPLSYDKTNTLQDAHPTRASLWRRGMDIIKH